LLDATVLIEQLVSLVWRGAKITHEHGAHDDHANAAALAVNVVREAMVSDEVKIVVPFIASRSDVYRLPGGLTSSDRLRFGKFTQRRATTLASLLR